MYFAVGNQTIGGQIGPAGYSPVVNVEPIHGGHKIVITDIDRTQSFNVIDGKDGINITFDEYDTTIYETGDSSVNWHVRKWSNGFCEMFAYKRYTSLKLNEIWQTPFYLNSNVLQPVGSFQLPVQLIEKYSEQYSISPGNTESSSDTVITPMFFVKDPTDASKSLTQSDPIRICTPRYAIVDVNVSLYVVGKWSDPKNSD